MKLVFRTLFAVAAVTAVASAFAQTPPATPAQTRSSTFDLPSNWGQAGQMRSGLTTLEPDDRFLARRHSISTAQVRPVPEPSQWALMAAGLGLVGWIVRRRSSRNKD